MPLTPSDSPLTYVIQASTTVTATGNSGAGVRLPIPAHGYIFYNDTTAIGAVMGDTFDLKIQTSFDGILWFDVCAFAALPGNNAARARMMKIAEAGDENGQIVDDRVSTLAAPATLNFFGVFYRARWIIVGGSPNYTFSVLALPI